MKKHFLVLTIATLLTAILTWPFLINLGSYYSDQGDYSLAGSVLWYNTQSLFSGKIFDQKEYLKGFQFYPQPYSLLFANNSFAPLIWFAPVFLITQNLPFSVNLYAFLTLVLSFVTSFYFVYYFVSEDGQNNGLVNIGAALVGAFIFAFNANTFVRFPQHLDILGKYFLPLVFLFAYKLLQKPAIKTSLLFFVFFSLNALTVNYYQLFSVVMLPFLVLPFLIRHLIKKDWGYFRKLGRVGLIGLIFLPVLLYFNLPYLQFSKDEGAERSLGETMFFSARVTDWLAASPQNLIYGGYVKSIDKFRTPKDDRGILNYEEHTLFVGLLPLSLFILGLKLFHKSKLNKTYFYLLLILPFLFTFGPFFGGKEEGLQLPFYLIYSWFPFMKGIRSPTRFEFLFLVPFALIVGFGVKRILQRKPDIKIITIIIIITVIIGLLTAENLTSKSFDSRSQALDAIEQTGKAQLSFLENKGVLHLPIYSVGDADYFGNNSAYVNWATQTKESIVNGNTAYLPPDQLGLLEGFKVMDEANLKRLSLLNVSYIVLHKYAVNLDQYEAYKSFLDQYKGSIVLENNRLLIFKVPNMGAKICNFPDDLTIKAFKTMDENGREGVAVDLKNNRDCFLVNAYFERYRKLSVELDGVSKNIQLRLPLFLEPGQDIMVSEVNGEVRTQ